ncbi:hypothetical protein GCM10022631_12860 [Deinococcus rubellus]|uniref:Lipoprotein n=1 Tax=Deinococcus rubellus TaxID=1889240 RepID=A0ABY5YDY7_9DEIO|nr:hypothetical protein [Deinococcus rubellus]UWX63287.1 hypothetical protein N0D28_11075 [Deinococcus rubellus]
MRRSSALLPALLLPALTLAACVPTQSRGPDYSALSGNYVGTASLGPIPAPYQLLLNVNGRTGRADGVLTRTSNGNVYSASGTFRPFDANSGMIDLKLFSTSRQAGTLSARVQGDKLDGFLKTGVLTFTVKLSRSRPPQPNQTQPNQTVPVSGNTGTRSVPTPSSSVTVETTQTETTTSVPVYVIPTPVTPPHP